MRARRVGLDGLDDGLDDELDDDLNELDDVLDDALQASTTGCLHDDALQASTTGCLALTLGPERRHFGALEGHAFADANIRLCARNLNGNRVE